MVKFDEVRTGGNMMPTATLAVGTTEGKISGLREEVEKVMGAMLIARNREK